jgi:hypothetical protein
MDKKVSIFAFNGDPMCFMHVMLNSLEMKEKEWDVKVIIEGSATKLVESLKEESNQMHGLYQKMKDQGLIDCVCRACSSKMGVLESVKEEDLPLCSEMSGHPSIGRYIEKGYKVIVF